jgi:acetyl esterase/lipase
MKPDFSPIHPELRQAAKKMPRISFNRNTMRMFRVLEKGALFIPKPLDIDIEDLLIPNSSAQGTLRLRIYRPKIRAAVPQPYLFWIHGGGFIGGTIEQNDAYCADMIRSLGLTVISTSYRTAPEHPFPIPLEDCHTALKWTVAHSALLGTDPDRLAIGGESAGGGLAAALAQLAHDRGEPQPLFQLLVYPMLDDRTCLRSTVQQTEFLVWDEASNHFGWESYLQQPPGNEAVPDYAVPARRMDLSGLPPAWIGVGSIDLFHDEDAAYARALLDCGVSCEFLSVPGAYHGFDLAGSGVNIVREFRQSQYAALRKYLSIIEA